MAIIPIPKAPFPLVPQVAGVPALLRGSAQIFDTLTLGVFGASNIVNSLIGSEPVRWGVFASDGKKIAQYDSVFSNDYQDDARISDYPIEKGAFAAYNKVDNPFTVRVVLSCGGNTDARNAFQNDLRVARRSLKLYTVLTEDGTFTNCNLVSLGWSRTRERGAARIEAYCDFQEVRQRNVTAFAQQTKEPSGADDLDQGQLQPIDDVTIDASGIA